ncbi:MAG: type II secretion system F family protein [Myxococcales bacterium]|nr:type II secretion system F family protein [Myxococcales bacterium]
MPQLNHIAYRWAVAAAVGLVLAFLTYAVGSAPTRVASRLGMRGLKRRRAIENNPAWAQIEPLVRWLGVRVSGILSEDFRRKLDRQLSLAGDWMGLTPEEYVGLSIVSFLGGLLVGAGVGVYMGQPAMMISICGPLFASFPYLLISGEAQERLKQVNRGLPFVIDLMALAMSAGLDFPGAIRQVVEKSSDPNDALVEEFTRILQELQLGRTRRQALLDFMDRVPTDQVTEFVNAIVQAEAKGNPVADVLQIQAGVSRMRRSVRAEELAAKAGVAMVGPLFLLFGCIMLLIVAPMIMKLAAVE